MSRLQVTLFHTFNATYNGQPLEFFELTRVQELFSFLLLQRDRNHRREFLIDILWGEDTPKKAQKYLRQLLWQLRAGLSCTDAGAWDAYLVTTGEWIGIRSSANIQLDVAQFEEACTLTQDIKGSELTPDQRLALSEAVDLYTGDLLEGCYQHWCLFERERLQNMYLLALEKLMHFCETHGEYETGLDYGMRALRCDEAHEATYRHLMRLSSLNGNRTGALRYYFRCVDALKTELGVNPGAQTTALYQQIEGNSTFDQDIDISNSFLNNRQEIDGIFETCQKLKFSIDKLEQQLLLKFHDFEEQPHFLDDK